MTTLIVPDDGDRFWPTLGWGVAEFLTGWDYLNNEPSDRFEGSIFGPGSLKGQRYKLDGEKLGATLKAYEVFPPEHRFAGRRRFKRVGLSWRKGTAKCLDWSVMLTMADGSRRRADQVRPADVVLSWDGTRLVPAEVSAVWEQLPAPRYRITTEHGRSLTVTSEHPFAVKGTRWAEGARAQWVKAEELHPGDRLMVAVDWAADGEGNLPTFEAWTLGAIVGDGTGDGRFTNIDADVLDRLRKRYELTPLAGDVRSCYLAGGIRPLLREHGLWGCNAHSKRVPPAVFTGGRWAIAAFLAGYLDTDGHVSIRETRPGKYATVVEWASVNHDLLADCQHLLTGLGVNASLRGSRSTYKGQWKLSVHDRAQAALLADYLLPSMVHGGKRSRLRQIAERVGRCVLAGHDLDRVVTVERLPDGPSVAIEVAETHTHITDGLITHNTEFAAEIVYAELHPEGPVRFDGWRLDGAGDFVRDPYTGAPLPVLGRAVRDPYIPMLAFAEEQVEELTYGALVVIAGEGPDAGRFDVGTERILRLDDRGMPDGKAVALAGSPSANDGARTTFQHFDEAVDLRTPVATPDGWREIGSLVVGDHVYDRFGKPVEVIGFSRTHVGRPCFRVTFNDGTSVVTDAGHLWKMTEWSNRPAGEQRVTTGQMFERGVDTGYGKRWRLPRAHGFDGVHVDLPTAPYLLGLWLGDGSSNHCAYIHSALDDYPYLSAGFEHTAKQVEANLVRWLPAGLTGALRRMGGLLGSKHIPDAYLFADRQQRLDLLQGLMDTDGHTTKGGNCTFVQGKRELCEQVALLVRSLGCEASIIEQTDPRSRTGSMFKVHFSPAFCPFRLPRKAKAADWRERRCTTRPAVVSIEPVESVPVRCIAVDSDDHLFLVGRGLHLTHNTHRMELPRLRASHNTMLANIPKRPLDDPWSLETTTAGRPGANSVAEGTHRYAQKIALGEIKEPRMFYFHREASAKWDMKKFEDRVEAIREATGPTGEYAPGQFEEIAAQWDEPDADRSYLERVWCNRWTQADAQAFDVEKFEKLSRPENVIPADAFCTLGFDGARFKDSTGFTLTEVATGRQMAVGLWERPMDLPDEAEWEVPSLEVHEKFEEIMKTWKVYKLYGDPPHWVEDMAKWAAKYPDVVVEWWTNRRRPMSQAARNYAEAISSDQIHPCTDPDLIRHIGNAGKVETNLLDEEGRKVWILGKIRPEAKFDLAMSAVLSWQARIDALGDGAGDEETYVPRRLDRGGQVVRKTSDVPTHSRASDGMKVRYGRDSVLSGH